MTCRCRPQEANVGQGMAISPGRQYSDSRVSGFRIVLLARAMNSKIRQIASRVLDESNAIRPAD